MNVTNVQYIVDAEGRNTGVILPIDLWEEITSEDETNYLLKNETMKKRLLEARQRKEGIPFDEVCEKFGF
ncbi:MAG: prevent-host-death protein [Candidatus Aminicenantes bacterium]|nr:prevent-host-death protein [Candidatus Aminicenantes bacterium]